MTVKTLTVSPLKKFSKELTVPGDKSVSHRAVMFGAIAVGTTEVRNFLMAEDCLHTLQAFKQLGIQGTFSGGRLVLRGKGLRGLRRAKGAVYVGNSGTSMRLLSGILAGQPFATTLKGDLSLTQRPMRRVILPLEEMGAEIRARKGGFPPLTIRGGALRAIRYRSPIPSAQVKSAILLAGLYADGKTTVIEPFKTRDHTERMLKQFGASLTLKGLSVSLTGGEALEGSVVEVPGDISSAAFFIVLAAVLKGSKVTVKNVGLNPTRTGFIQILKRMGAEISLFPKKGKGHLFEEPMGTIEVKGTELTGTVVTASEIPALIDELPILMVAGAAANGRTFFKGATELRIKETDRIHSMVKNLRKMGISIWNEKDDVVIEGGKPFHGAKVESFKDHRTAMSLAIAGRLARRGDTLIRDASCIDTSFPGFINLI
jgi:3-phosphoshikimate 1-carboxyvinyltransferase